MPNSSKHNVPVLSFLYDGKAPSRNRSCHTLPRKLPYVIAASSWLVGLVGICTLGYQLGYANWHGVQADASTLLAAIIAVLTGTLAYFLSRGSCTCPLCHGKHLVNGRSQKHSKAFRLPLLSYSTSSTLSLLSRQTIRCMHCGTPFDLLKRRK